LRQLEAFAAVATELDSGGRTRSCISDTTLSDLIRRLERELGTPAPHLCEAFAGEAPQAAP
jgi:hypothetical protein